MRQQDRTDLGLHGKSDPKADFGDLNDLFMNNFLRNPGSFNQFLDKAGANPEFFNPASANGQNLPFDANLLYNFSNMGPPSKMSSTTAQSNPMDQNNLYFQNMNNNFMLPHNFGLNNPNIYEDLLKNANPPHGHGQVELNDKNLFNHGLLPENPGQNQFLLDGLDFKPQDATQSSNQQNPMGMLNSLQNQMLFNNLPYGSDLGLNSFLLPGMSNFNLEDLYNMQMNGAVPPNQIPHNLGPLPKDLKVENPNHLPQKHQQNTGHGARNATKPSQEAPQNNQRPEQKMPNPFANQNSNPQDMGILNGLGSKSMSMPMSMGSMFNFPMPSIQSVQSMMLPKEMESQSQLLKFMAGGMDTSHANESAKTGPQTGMQNSFNTTQIPSSNLAKDHHQNKVTSAEEPKSNAPNPIDMAKSAGLTTNELDLLGRGMFDPFMMGGPPGLKTKSSTLDPLGLEDPSFLEAHSNLYNKMKEKNRYERSLKIERYKNKKRNWTKKIAYDCRKRVADTRLRIKGRFISKKDSEKIQQLVGKQEDAFNDKKNLNLDYLTNRFNITGDAEEITGPSAGKPNISKAYLLNKIDEILHNNKNPLPSKNLANNMRLSNIVKSHLCSQSKKIFKIRSRREDRGLTVVRDASNNSSEAPYSLKQEPTKNLPKVKNEAYSDALAQMNAMNHINMDPQMIANGLKNFYSFAGNVPENFGLSSEMDGHTMANMNMLALSMGMNMGNIGNMANMGMGMRGNPFEMRPEQHEEAGHDMTRYK